MLAWILAARAACSTSACRRSRSLELADCGCLLAIVVGSPTHDRGPPPLGASAIGRSAYSRSSPSPLHRHINLPSRQGESHPLPLTEPDVNLSIHPARA